MRASRTVLREPRGETPRGYSPDPQEMQGFYDRVTACLQASIGEDGEPLAEKLVLTFSAEATTRYHHIRAGMEDALRPGGSLVNVKDYAAKAPRHLARLAGVFEFFETGNTVISLEMLERAHTVITWFINEYIRLFTPPPAIPQVQLDADLLYPKLNEFARQRCNRYLVQNDVLKHAPNCMRSKFRFEQALQVLWQRRLIGLYQLGKIRYIDMAPLQPYDPTALQMALNSYRAKRSQTPSPALY